LLGVSPHGVFCDYLTVTCNPDQSFASEVEALLLEVGLSRSRTQPGMLGLWDSEKKRWYGKAFLTQPHGVDRLAVGGAILGHLRRTNSLGYLLQTLLSVPYNVTRVDVALDRSLPDSDTLYGELQRILKLARGKGVHLSRKAVPRGQVIQHFAEREWDSVLSGTVQLGRRGSRYSATVYDKVKEQHDRFGRSPPVIGELLRYEVRTTEASLRDVLDPDPLFFHLASPDLLPSPSDVPAWEKRPMEPLNLPPRNVTTYALVKRLLLDSPDVERAFEILAESGDVALTKMMRRQMQERFDSLLNQISPSLRKQA